MIDPFSEMVNLMRGQGSQNNTALIQLATMTGPTTCTIGNAELKTEDLYIPDRLLSAVCTKVSVSESFQDKSSYSTALKTGDTVILFQLSDTKFVILDRVVSGA